MKTNPQTRKQIPVSVEVWRQLKVAAATQDTTIRALTELAVKEYFKRGEK